MQHCKWISIVQQYLPLISNGVTRRKRTEQIGFQVGKKPKDLKQKRVIEEKLKHAIQIEAMLQGDISMQSPSVHKSSTAWVFGEIRLSSSNGLQK
jgi:hypothetical protein